MKIYLVGGAVRDQLLGLPVTERDYVVVGTTPEEMLKRGFKPVGKDFPVFLHPITHDEYALARTERKIKLGYKGFSCYAAPDVTLEDDLKRRDLTINAMAQDLDGTIIDPYGGQQDLQQHMLRHVSEAFSEDPVRILRIARFTARYGDFTIHPTTLKLMQNMVENGEVDALVAERVWQELERALMAPYPHRFFITLQACGALSKLFAPIDCKKAATILKDATTRDTASETLWAALFYTLDTTAAKELATRYNAPWRYQDLALLVARYGKQCVEDLQAIRLEKPDAKAKALLELLAKLDTFRRPERFYNFLQAVELNVGPIDANLLLKAYSTANAVDVRPLLEQGLQGQEIATALQQQRIAAIANTIF